MNIFKTINLLGALQGFIIFLVLFSQGKPYKRANRFLSLTVFVLAANLLLDYFFHGRSPVQYLDDTFFHVLAGFACGPLIYLYIRSVSGLSFPAKGAVVLYFVPLAAASLYMTLYISPRLGRILSGYYFFIEIASLVHVLSFIVLAIGHIYTHEKALRNSYSNTEKLSLLWQQYFLYSLAIIMVIAVFLYTRGLKFTIIWILVAVLIYILSFVAMKKPDLLSGLVMEADAGKYTKSSLKPEAILENRMRIEQCMEEQKLFMDNEITLPALAEKVSVPLHHLSQIINQEYKMNFNEFINRYRIETAKEMMRSPEFDEVKIIDICYRVGFNAISAFNKSFKKNTGLTPTQFRRIINQP